MGKIPCLTRGQIRSLGRILGTDQKLNLTVPPRSKARHLPEYPEDAEINGGVVLAKITDGTAEAGYSVQLFANGRSNDATGNGTVFLPEVALTGTLPAGSWVLAHLTEVIITGGNDA